MEERVGAYIIDSEGNLIPDLNDAAMAARQNGPTPIQSGMIPDPVGDKIKDTEVNKDA